MKNVFEIDNYIEACKFLLGDIRTVAVGRQKKYLLADILKLKN